MPYVASLEVVVNLLRFVNVDLLSQGLYYWSVSVKEEGPNGNQGKPYAVTSGPGGPNGNEGGLPMRIDQNEKRVCSKTVHIKYIEQIEETGETARFILNVDMLKLIRRCGDTILLTFDLYHVPKERLEKQCKFLRYGDAEGGEVPEEYTPRAAKKIGKALSDGKEEVEVKQDGKRLKISLSRMMETSEEGTQKKVRKGVVPMPDSSFKRVATRTIPFKLASILRTEWVPVTWDNWFFARVDCLISTCITGVHHVPYNSRAGLDLYGGNTLTREPSTAQVPYTTLFAHMFSYLVYSFYLLEASSADPASGNIGSSSDMLYSSSEEEEATQDEEGRKKPRRRAVLLHLKHSREEATRGRRPKTPREAGKQDGGVCTLDEVGLHFSPRDPEEEAADRRMAAEGAATAAAVTAAAAASSSSSPPRVSPPPLTSPPDMEAAWTRVEQATEADATIACYWAKPREQSVADVCHSVHLAKCAVAQLTAAISSYEEEEESRQESSEPMVTPRSSPSPRSSPAKSPGSTPTAPPQQATEALFLEALSELSKALEDSWHRSTAFSAHIPEPSQAAALDEVSARAAFFARMRAHCRRCLNPLIPPPLPPVAQQYFTYPNFTQIEIREVQGEGDVQRPARLPPRPPRADHPYALNLAEASGCCHLLVFVHGWKGNPCDLALFKNYLHLYLPPGTEFYCVGSMTDTPGVSIRKLGQLVAAEVADYITMRELQLTKLSFVGHSMGSVVTRAALQSPQLAPYLDILHTFISLSGPHLGIPTSDSRTVGCVVGLLSSVKRDTNIRELRLDSVLLHALSSNDKLGLFKHVLLFASEDDRFVGPYSALANPPQGDRPTLKEPKKKKSGMVRDIARNITASFMRCETYRRFHVRFKPHGRHELTSWLDRVVGKSVHIAFLVDVDFIHAVINNFLEYF